jgi:hypothetical protein
VIIEARINLQTLHCETCNASFTMIGASPRAIEVFATTHTDHGLTVHGQTIKDYRLSLSLKIPPSFDLLKVLYAIK